MYNWQESRANIDGSILFSWLAFVVRIGKRKESISITEIHHMFKKEERKGKGKENIETNWKRKEWVLHTNTYKSQ
jgi:hypothetical protein